MTDIQRAGIPHALAGQTFNPIVSQSFVRSWYSWRCANWFWQNSSVHSAAARKVCDVVFCLNDLWQAVPSKLGSRFRCWCHCYFAHQRTRYSSQWIFCWCSVRANYIVDFNPRSFKQPAATSGSGWLPNPIVWRLTYLCILDSAVWLWSPAGRV